MIKNVLLWDRPDPLTEGESLPGRPSGMEYLSRKSEAISQFYEFFTSTLLSPQSRQPTVASWSTETAPHYALSGAERPHPLHPV